MSGADRIPDEIAFQAINPQAYADDSVHDAFRWLRANQPLGRAELEGVEPFWLVTKHADIVEIEKQPEIFASEPRPILGREVTRPEMRADVMAQIFQRYIPIPDVVVLIMRSSF